MASAHDEERPPPQQTLRHQVSIHCEGCKRKVKQVLLSIEGVYIVTIDSKQHKVTVIGNINAQTLIKKLVKTGKRAELWAGKPAGKDKKNGKSNNNEKENDSKSCENSDEEEEENLPQNREAKLCISKNGANVGQVVPKTNGKPPGNMTSGGNFPMAPQKGNPNMSGNGGGQGGKKKKKKGRKSNNNSNNSNAAAASASTVPPSSTGVLNPNSGPTQVPDQTNLSPSDQHLCHDRCPPSYASHQDAYVVSYNAAYSSAFPTCYIPPSASPYTLPESETSSENFSSALSTFEILSDENPNGCHVM